VLGDLECSVFGDLEGSVIGDVEVSVHREWKAQCEGMWKLSAASMGLWRARIGSEHLGMESSGSRDFDGSDHGEWRYGLKCGMYRRLTVWKLGSLW
jgi:hypothetical protein